MKVQRKFYNILIAGLMAIILPTTLNAQTKHSVHESELGEKELVFDHFEFTPQLLNLYYEIPYGGMVEFRLFDQEGNLVWINQGAREMGKHKISMKLAAFDFNKHYSYKMKFKLTELNGDIPIELAMNQ